MKHLTTMAAAVALLALTGIAIAADTKADPNGTWKFSQEQRGNTVERTLKLKLSGDKLEGTVTSGRENDQEVKIEDATFKDGEVAFNVTREFNGNKFVSKYKGKVDGDTIKGKIETERNGEKREVDWNAKREKK